MKKYLLVLIMFFVFICSSWAAEKKSTTPAKNNTPSEDYLIRKAVKCYLCAIRDLDATKCWALMSKESQQRFADIFYGLQKKTFSADSEMNFYFPPAGKCKNPNDYLHHLFEIQPNMLPSRCTMIKEVLTDTKVIQVVKDADIILRNDKACFEFIDTEVHGMLNLVREKDGWKVDNALEYDPLGI
jgi:hypothetical protein